MNLSIIILTLAAAGIGFLVGQFLTKKKNRIQEADFKNLEKEHRQLLKVEKKGRKDVDKAKKQAAAWKEKFETLSTESTSEIEILRDRGAEAEATIKSLEETNAKLGASNKILENDKERLSSKYENLDKRYKDDLEGLKEWRADKSRFDSHLKDFKSKLKLAEEQVVKLKALNQKQAADVVNAHEVTGKLRMLNAQLKKYKDDLKYWETQHYEVNHELTNYKNTYSKIYYEHEDLKKELEALQNENKAMENKVAEYKSRFVTINKEYHELLREKGEFGKV